MSACDNCNKKRKTYSTQGVLLCMPCIDAMAMDEAKTIAKWKENKGKTVKQLFKEIKTNMLENP